MQRSVILIITIVIVVVLVTSLLVFIEVSKQPHIAFISERTAEEISGQNYTLSSQTTTTGIALPYGPYGEKLVQGVLYRNEPQFTTNGSFSNYYFQDAVMEFNNTTMAQTVYQLESGFLDHGNIGTIYPTANGTYSGFSYTYTTVSQQRFGQGYFWGTCGYSGDLVFEITGQSPLPPNANMSAVAIDQIDAMTAFSF